MLSQAANFVTPLSLVAPKCKTCNDTGSFPDPFSDDPFPCDCNDGAFNLRQFNTLLAKNMVVTLAPADDTRWPDDVHEAYFGEGY